jgi:hypothetical protein
MRVKLERKRLKVGEFIEIPNWSYNHAYSSVQGEEIDILYLVPETKDDAILAMSPKSQKESP